MSLVDQAMNEVLEKLVRELVEELLQKVLEEKVVLYHYIILALTLYMY